MGRGAADDEEGKNCNMLVKLLNLCTMVTGGYLVFVGVTVWMDKWADMHVHRHVTNFYATFMGLLVALSAFKFTWTAENFAFLFKFLGRSLFYFFIAVYMMSNVPDVTELGFSGVTGDMDVLLPCLAALMLIVLGFSFLFLMCGSCHGGCFGDGVNVEVDITVMKNTAMKQQYACVDGVLRILSLAAGGFLVFCSFNIFKGQYVVVSGAAEAGASAGASAGAANWDTAVAIGALYGGIFGLTIIFAVLEIKFFLKWFGFLGKPAGRGCYYLFVSVYYMGISQKVQGADVDFFDQDIDQLLPFFAGAFLMGTGIIYMLAWFMPCVGPCMSDSAALSSSDTPRSDK